MDEAGISADVDVVEAEFVWATPARGRVRLSSARWIERNCMAVVVG
jgi:hypothetical protein